MRTPLFLDRVRSPAARREALWLGAGLLWALGGPAACAVDAAAGSAPGPAIERLKATIGDAGCDSDAQCRTVAVGAKACGGPESFMAWSSTGAQRAAVEQAAADVAAERQAASPPDGRMSTCSVVLDPGAACVGAAGARRCVLRAPGGGAGLPVR